MEVRPNMPEHAKGHASLCAAIKKLQKPSVTAAPHRHTKTICQATAKAAKKIVVKVQISKDSHDS